MDISMVTLEGANTSFTLPVGFNAFGGGNGCGQGGNIRYLEFNGCLTNMNWLVSIPGIRPVLSRPSVFLLGIWKPSTSIHERSP
jgi:hypothetical protein